MPTSPFALVDALRLGHRRLRVLLRIFDTPRRPSSRLGPQLPIRFREALHWISRQRGMHQQVQEQLLAALDAYRPAQIALSQLADRHRDLQRQEKILLDLSETAATVAVDADSLIADAAQYVQEMLAYLEDEERLLFPLLSAQADRFAVVAEDTNDPLFQSADDGSPNKLREYLLSQVERVPGKGSLRYAVLGAAVAETFGLLHGQCSELFDQQQRHAREAARLVRRQLRRLGSAPAGAKFGLAQEALQQQSQTLLRHSQQVAGVLRHDLGELRSAFAELRHTVNRTRSRGTPLHGPSWQCQLFNLATRASVKQSMRTAKNFDELHSALRRIGQGRAPEEFWFEGHRFRAAWQDAPSATRNRVILYFCGGGFMAPPSKFHDSLGLRLARIAAAPVFTVHYRLLPEHPFPAALDDAVAAYRFLLQSGYRAGEIVLAGDSAGGCLTLSLLLSLRDRGLPLPAAAAVLSPLTDLSCSGRSRQRNRWHDPLTAAQEPDLLTPRYLPAGLAMDDPVASPLFGDYRGLPPILAQVGSTEILLDDVLRLAPRARAAAVDFRVQVWPGLPHCWPIFSFLPEADAALQEMAAHFQEHWASQARRRAA